MKTRDDFDPAAYWENRLGSEFTLKGVGFTTLGRRYNEWMYKVRREVFLRSVHELPVDVTRAQVADVGSGTGFYIGLWRELGARDLTGVDLAKPAVEGLRRVFPDVRFEQLDIGEPFDDTLPAETFDLVSCCDVLFHIVDDARFAQAIDNISRLLRPGGYFLYSDNFVHGGAIRAKRRHQVSRSLAEIETTLRDAGLDPVKRLPMFVLMNAPIDSESRARRVLWGAAMRALTITEPTGWLTGAMLYPIERRLVRSRVESASTELMVCRRRT